MKVQSTENKKCEMHKVGPYRCRRKARIVRTTSKGIDINLCSKCDQSKINDKAVGDIIES